MEILITPNGRLRKTVSLILILFVLLIGVIDFNTDPEASLAFLYFIPITIGAWILEWKLSLFLSLLFLSIQILDHVFANTPTAAFLSYFHIIGDWIVFLLTIYILTAARHALNKEKFLSTTDALTGLINIRQFFKVADQEIIRASRYHHPLTLAFMDFDNFKSINDRYGHLTGDLLLKKTGSVLRKILRETDLVARLGGDEFAILLPETNPESAKKVVFKVKEKILKMLEKNGWNISFSTGVITYLHPPTSVQAMLKETDSLMYSVKKSQKGQAKFLVI